MSRKRAITTFLSRKERKSILSIIQNIFVNVFNIQTNFEKWAGVGSGKAIELSTGLELKGCLNSPASLFQMQELYNFTIHYIIF